jgi:hypothetical protein
MHLEHITGTVGVTANGGIAVRVLNHSDLNESARVRIFENTGAGAVQAADSGVMNLAPTFTGAFAFTVQNGGDCWVQVQASSESVVATADFQRPGGTMTSYSPGDFAVFERGRRLGRVGGS